ncbi:MAG TPA: DUF4350 domain-containing protein, partial [Cyclobacteriaceae bacterium]|nr:DUF4350 domain-containing protein [Cyclobacteriaceae bacterium]
MTARYFLSLMVIASSAAYAQQVPDTTFIPDVGKAKYSMGKGPVVVIDEAHYNFHTAVGRYRPFAMLLERDGYVVKRGRQPFTTPSLQGTKILVISNALSERNSEQWILPTPSAFTNDEISQLKQWVTNGGSLFLIADHMPIAGCAEDLAKAFGFTFYNGFAFDTTKTSGPDLFNFANQGLKNTTLTKGLDDIYTFTGQAFDCPPAATPIIVPDHRFKLWLPKVAWEFDHDTKKIEAQGKAQGAYMSFGKGRLVVFGEAAMFSAQIAGNGSRMGFNNPMARNNPAFLLRLIHWLDTGLPE